MKKDNSETLKNIIEKDNDKEFKLFIQHNPNWETIYFTQNKLNKRKRTEEFEKDYSLHFIISSMAIKILKMIQKIRPEIKDYSNNLTDENMIHICLTAETSLNNYFSETSTNNKNNGSQSSRCGRDSNASTYNTNINAGKAKCEFIQYLIFDMKVNLKRDNDGNTEFHKLLFHPCKNCFNALLNYSLINTNKSYSTLKNNDGLNPLQLSIQSQNYEFFTMLRFSHIKFEHLTNKTNNNLLHLCAYGGNIKILQDVLQDKLAKERINDLNAEGKSPFHIACQQENYQAASFLLKYDVKVTKNDINILKTGSDINLYKTALLKLQSKSVNRSNSVRPRPSFSNIEEQAKQIQVNSKSQGREEIKTPNSIFNNELKANFHIPQIQYDTNDLISISDTTNKESETTFKFNSSYLSPNIIKNNHDNKLECLTPVNIDKQHMFIYDSAQKIKNRQRMKSMNITSNTLLSEIPINTKSKSDETKFEVIEPIDFKHKSSNNFFIPTKMQKSTTLITTFNSQIRPTNYTKTPNPFTINKSPPVMIAKSHNLTKYLNESKKSSNVVYEDKFIFNNCDTIEKLNSKNSSELNSNLNLNFLIDCSLIKSFSLLNYQDIILEEKIYSFDDSSAVFKGKYLGVEVGIKEYYCEKFDEIDKKHFNSELSLLISLRHPRIVSFIGFCNFENKFLIVTEYMKNKSLKHLLDNKSFELSLLDKIKFSLDIAKAIWYLHTRNPPVLHRDLKSSNCLVGADLTIKLCDFGLSKIFLNEHQTETTSNIYWMSPESIISSIYTEKSDIYSFSILLWEIFHRNTNPYKGINETCFLFENQLKEIRPKIDINLMEEIKCLIIKCWDFEPTKRPSIKEVVCELEKINVLIG